MSYFQKIRDFDVSALRAQLQASPDLWGAFGWRKELGPHTRMTDIWVRYNDIRPFQARSSMAGFNDEHDSVWYPAYRRLPALKDIIYPLMAEVEGERLGGVLITRIPHGAGIDTHVDAGWHVDYFDKFYVSVESAPGARFNCHAGYGEVLEPKVGEVWRFDNRLPHSVVNDSGQDRVTLIVCIKTEKYGSEHASIA